jgi:hypothetical protein
VASNPEQLDAAFNSLTGIKCSSEGLGEIIDDFFNSIDPFAT